MTEDTIKISIIIPVYQTEAYLAACVKSLQAQSFRDWEAILVEDGSPDGSGALCDALAGQDKRIRVLHTENGGVSRARNRGIKIARGDYLLFLDSDDCLAPGCLMRLWTLREAHGVPLAACALTDKETVGDAADFDPPQCQESEAFLRQALAIDSPIMLSACGVLYPAAWQLRFEEDIAYGEDSLFFCQALKQGKQIVYTPEPLYIYRTQREGNTFTRQSLRKEKDSLRVWQSIRELFGQSDPALNSEISRILLDKQLQAARQAAREGERGEKRSLQKAAVSGLPALLKDKAIRKKDKLRLGLLAISPVWGAGLWDRLKGGGHE